MTVVRVDVGELRQMATHLGGLGGFQEDLGVRERSEVTNLGNTWRGGAYQTFVGQNNRFLTDLGGLAEQTHTLASVATHNADLYEHVQQVVADGQVSTGPITVDTQAYITASNTLLSAQAKVSEIASALVGSLAGCGSMAGDDDAGKQWVASYDAAVTDVLQAFPSAQEAINAWGGRFVDTANAWDDTENAVSNGKSPSGSYVYTGTVGSSPGGVPSAGGAGLGFSPEWAWLSDAIQGVWPTADTGKLRAAGSAWDTAASNLDSLASEVGQQPVTAMQANTSPEVRVLTEGVNNLGSELTGLADYCREMGRACNGYADEVDAAHTALRDEILAFIAETAAIAGITILAGTITAGVGAAIGATGIAARVAAFGARLAPLVARLTVMGAKIVTLATRVGAGARGVQASLKSLGVVKKISVTASRAPGWAKTLGTGARKVGTIGAQQATIITGFGYANQGLTQGAGLSQDQANTILGAAAILPVAGRGAAGKGKKPTGSSAGSGAKPPTSGVAGKVPQSVRERQVRLAEAQRMAPVPSKSVSKLITDKDAPWGRDVYGRPLTKEIWNVRNGDGNGKPRWTSILPEGKALNSTNSFTNPQEFTRIYGTKLDRISRKTPDKDTGSYLAIGGTSFERRAMEPESVTRELYDVTMTGKLPKGWSIEVSTAAPGNGYKGGGTQLRVLDENKVPQKISTLINKKVVEYVPVKP